MTILIIISCRRPTFDFISGWNGKFRAYPEGAVVIVEGAGCLGFNEQVLELYNNARTRVMEPRHLRLHLLVRVGH